MTSRSKVAHLVVRPGAPLRGSVLVPGDKSISHRALLLGAIADGTSRVQNFLPASDCLATLNVVRALGVNVAELGPGVPTVGSTCESGEPQATTLPTSMALAVHGVGLHGLCEPEQVLDCRRSGTTMRLLAGVMAGQPTLSVLTGEAQLLRRPMARIVEPLRQMGATILGRDGGRLPPLAIQGGALRGIQYELPVASAQVKSALLLAGLYADGPTTLHIPGPARDHTERMMAAMGADVQADQTGVQGGPPRSLSLRITPVERLQPLDTVVPGDLSSAAFLLVAAALVPGSEVTVQGVGVNPTRTGLLELLHGMGADLSVHDLRTVGGEPVADLTIRASELQAVEVGGDLVVRTIDEFPILAVAATQARGETLVRDAAELRVKETDRIATTVAELQRLGAEIEARPDGFVVRGPTPLRAAEVNSHGDHRLAMALVVAGLIARGATLVHDCSCVTDSFPGFETTLCSLGGSLS